MIRAQILLEEEQYDFLKKEASEHGKSMSAVVREMVDMIRKKADHESRRRRAMAYLGRFEGDRSDVSVHHDWYLADLQPPRDEST